ncbi:MAG: FKBP-type peptidyl-prolyl cis-trans isomerase [Actinomycetota bacterium]|nr:FKBP-type peptidyl-prolyl cis-trans isomerase [Actinomycetota bacterium]
MSKMRSFTWLLALVLLVFAACGDDAAETPPAAETTPAAEAPPAGDCEEGIVETESGLKYEETECGTGEEAGRGDTVIVKYKGALENGKVFDEGELPPFQLGSGSVIPGFDEGITGMKVGGSRQVTIPPDLGYGAQGVPPDIPPNSTLIFDIELVEIQAPA